MLSSVEDFALRIGSYVPRSAGAGGSYFSGSARIDPGRSASGGVLAVAPPQDEYIPSNAPASAETEGRTPKKRPLGGSLPRRSSASSTN